MKKWDETLRIESADLDATDGRPTTLPLYVGGRSMGRERVTASDQGMSIHLSSADGPQTYHIPVMRMRRSGFAFKCPECDGWRKRLFFIEREKKPSIGKFLCQRCGGLGIQIDPADYA